MQQLIQDCIVFLLHIKRFLPIQAAPITLLIGTCILSGVIKNAETISMSLFSHSYRLCVLASGSLITVIFSFCKFTKICCLHFGQNRGKFLRIVSFRTMILVLLWHIGQSSHSSVFTVSSSLPE